MSITLLIGALYGILFALLLWFAPRNKFANRFLACLLIVIAMRLLPYIIGFAGYYDAYPWLSFAPYNASLAFGPLLYFYAVGLSAAAPPPRWRIHFVPVVLQLLYYCIIFAQPLAFKNAWNTAWHVPYLMPAEQWLSLTSMAIYWWLSLKHYRDYQRWLVANVSDREDHHVEWLRNFLIALAATLALWIALVSLEQWVVRLNYFQRFPFYVWLSVLTYYLGTEGYRHARHRYPLWTEGEKMPESVATVAQDIAPAAQTVIQPSQEPSVAPVSAAAPESAPAPALAPPPLRDWQQQAYTWRDKIIAAGWWQDPEITLAKLARKLGTNTSDLSRAINDGLGLNFNELINRLRVDAVKAAIVAADPSQTEASLLDIAFAAGFSSKASFNRSFKLYTGQTPSQYRAQVGIKS